VSKKPSKAACSPEDPVCVDNCPAQSIANPNTAGAIELLKTYTANTQFL
jgi:hypothetical protein